MVIQEWTQTEAETVINLSLDLIKGREQPRLNKKRCDCNTSRWWQPGVLERELEGYQRTLLLSRREQPGTEPPQRAGQTDTAGLRKILTIITS